jgi:hypothetical protein
MVLSDQVCLDTETTSSTAAAERRQVGLATAVKAADEAGKGRGMDTVATQDATGETCTPIRPQTTYKTKMEEYKDEKVILKRQMQDRQFSCGTGLLDLEQCTRCRQLRYDFDTSEKRHERPHTRTQQSMQNRQNSSRMEEESEQEQDGNARKCPSPTAALVICLSQNEHTAVVPPQTLSPESILEGGSICVGFCPMQLSLHNLLVQEAFWRGGVVFA